MELRQRVNKIRELLSERAAYEQLAEESAELAQAALKYVRALNPQDNPTPMHPVDAYVNVVEEAADVYLVLQVLGVPIDIDLATKKADRWINRLDLSKPKKEGTWTEV